VSAFAVLDAARAAGVAIEAAGEDLLLGAPQKPPTALLDAIRRHKPALLDILRKQAAHIPEFPASGQLCAICGGQWWWARVDGQGREIAGWSCGSCLPPPRTGWQALSNRNCRWTWSGQENEPIPLQPDVGAARARHLPNARSPDGLG
jgi:hypothetical protein